MIIDNDTPGLTEAQRISHTGEVLLAKDRLGILTAPQAAVHEIRKMSTAERQTLGWDVYQPIIDALPDVLPGIGVASDQPLPESIPNPFGL